MKKSDIEKRLKQDLDVAAPSDFDGVWGKCAAKDYRLQRQAEETRAFVLAGADGSSAGKGTRGGNGKRVLSAFLAAVFVVIAVAVAVYYAVKLGGAFTIAKGSFILDINPSVQVSYDERGNVTQASGLNEDGNVLLYGLDLTGETCEEAVADLFERCVRLGYFEAARTDNALLVSAATDEGNADEEMTAKMKSWFVGQFKERKICGVVITGVNDPTMEAAAKACGVDVQKYALIREYLALGGELDKEEYAEITVRELYTRIDALLEAKENEELSETEIQKQAAWTKLKDELSNGIGEIVEQLKARIGTTEDGEEQPAAGTAPIQPTAADIGGHGNEVVPPEGNDYGGRLDELEAYTLRIENAATDEECRGLVREILIKLEEMARCERDEELKTILEIAHGKIAALFAEFESVLKRLDWLRAKDVADVFEERTENFKDKQHGVSQGDPEAWQKTYEEEYTTSWYELKNSWEESRRNDWQN